MAAAYLCLFFDSWIAVFSFGLSGAKGIDLAAFSLPPLGD
jgi:hypothetical protein